MKTRKYIFLFVLIGIVSLGKTSPTPTGFKYVAKAPTGPNFASWTIRYPSSFVPLDGLFAAIGNSFPHYNNYPQSPPGENPYPYHHVNPHHYPNPDLLPPFYDDSEDDSESSDFNESESNTKDVLVESLKTALQKLNLLIPSKSSTETSDDFSQNSESLKPEILAESVNKAIDKLTEILSKMPLLKPQSTLENYAYPSIITTSTADSINLPTISSQQMSLSAVDAINQLEKLFNTLPDELKQPQIPKKPDLIPSRKPEINNNNGQKPEIILGTQSFRPSFIPDPVVYPEPQIRPIDNKQNSVTEIPLTLFTSRIQDVKPEAITTTEINEVFTSSSKTTTENNEVFTSSSRSTTERNELFTSSTVSKNKIGAESEMLFTSSDVKNKETTSIPAEEVTTDNVNIDMLFTSSSNQVVNSSETATVQSEIGAAKQSNVETAETTTNVSEETTEKLLIAPIEENSPSDNNNSEITSNSEATTKVLSLIDVRIGEDRSTDDAIVFPDQFEIFRKPDKLSPSNIHENELSLPTRFGEQDNKAEEAINLEFKPNVPYQYPSLPMQNPFLQITGSEIVGGLNLIDRNKVSTTSEKTSTSKKEQNTLISLEYKPTRPPFAPNPIVYPMPIIPPGAPWPASSSENPIQQLGDRNKIPTTTERIKQKPDLNTPISLEYKPTRPPFAPNPVVYPMPFIPPGKPWPASSSENPNQQLGDRNKITTTTEKIKEKPDLNTPISLEYKPTRPPFAPDPIVYPMPIIPPGTPWPASSTEHNKVDPLGNRNKVTSTERTTAIVTKKPYYPTLHVNTPISLEYKPTRPPYAPDPWIYPSPGLINAAKPAHN